MNLYQLTGAARELQELLEAGEIDQTLYEDTLEGMGYQDKIENICKVVRNLEAQAEAFKAEKDRMAERERIAKNGIERLKNSLLASMQTLNKKKIDAGVFTVTRTESKAVSLDNNAALVEYLPAEFLIPQPPKIDRFAIAKALKEGQEIIGAEMKVSEYVRIR